MKTKLIFSFLLFVGSTLTLLGQSYSYLQTTGTSTDYHFDTSGTIIFEGTDSIPINNILSSWQNIPFTWKFYGQGVSGYYVSINGYLTFDQNASSSNSINISLPSTSAPKNAIFAFWDSLQLFKPDTNNYFIQSQTYGNSPNRVHAINWYNVYPNPYDTGDNSYCFSIRLYESGDVNFDIVYDFLNPDTGNTVLGNSTVGIQDDGATEAKMVAGSPDFQFPSSVTSSENSDDVVFSFYYDPVEKYDLTVTNVNMTELVKISSNNNVKGVIQNLGTETITSFDLNYRANSDTVITNTINTTITSQSTYNFTASTPWTPTVAGQYYEIEVWASNLNGSITDEYTANDTGIINIFVNEGISGTKRVLLEIATGTNIGEGPDVRVKMDEILENESNVSAISYYNAGGDLVSINGITINSTFITNYPSGFIDRTLFDGQSSVGISRTLWYSKVTERLNAATPVNINITDLNYSPGARTVKVQGTIDFVDHVGGDVRITAAVYESTAWNMSSDYDQDNNYNYTSGHEYYGKGNPIVGYGHRHVVRKFLTDKWGAYVDQTKPGPDIFLKNSSLSFDLTSQPIALNWNDDMFHILVWINMIDASDISKMEVLNVVERKLTTTYSTPEDYITELSAIYPNPVEEIGRIDFTLSKTSEISLEILNTLGQKVQTNLARKYASGKHSIYFDANKLPAGSYIVILKANDLIYSKTFIK